MIPELVTRAQADALMGGVPMLGLVAGAVAFAYVRRRGGDGLLYGLLWGGPPILAGVLWRVYNVITDRLGLDSVANLLVNLAMFVGLGALCGWGWVWLSGRRAKTTPNVADSTEVAK